MTTVPDLCYDFHLTWTIEGSTHECETALAFRRDSLEFPSNSALGEVITDFVTAMQPVTGNAVVFTGGYVLVGVDPPDVPVRLEFGSTTTGAGSASTLCMNSCWQAQKRSVMGGRKGRGRMYFWPPAETVVDPNGSIDSTTRGGFESALWGWIDDQLAKSWIEAAVLLHENPADAPTIIPNSESFPVNSKVSTQRRRLRP